MEYSSVFSFTTSDIFLLPLYLILIAIFYRVFLKKFSTSLNINKYVIWAIIFKIALAIIQLLILEYLYNGEGDMKGYYINCKELNNYLTQENVGLIKFYSNVEFYFNEVNFTYIKNYPYNATTVNVMYFALPIYRLASGSFLILAILCSFLAFLGSFSLFKFFHYSFPNAKTISIFAAFFIPSFSLWSAGLFKETFAISALGILVFSLYKLLMLKQKIVLNVFLSAFCIYTIFLIKPYLLFVLLGVFIVVFKEVLKKISQNKVLVTFFYIISFGIITFVLNTYLTTDLSDNSGLDGFAADNILDNIATSKNSYTTGSTFSIGDFDPTSIVSVISKIPIAIFICFFRPFLWESKNPLMLINAIESFIMLYLFIIVLIKYRLKIFKVIYRNNFLFGMLIFALLFGGVITLPTANFGTLVRYKAPCMPFFSFSLMYLYVHRNIIYSIYEKK